MTIAPLALGVLVGLALAMSTRMRDALVEGLGRRSLVLGVVGAAGVAVVHALWLALPALLAGGSGEDLGGLVGPLGVLGAAAFLAVAADVVLRAVTLGPTTGSPAALPDAPARTFLQMLVIAALDPRALLVLLGWLALAPSTAAAMDPGAVVAGIAAAVVGWWLALAWLGATTRSSSRLRRAANVWGAALLVFVAAVTLVG